MREHRDLIDAGLILNPDAGGGMSSGNRRLYMGLETSEKSYVTFGLEVTNKGGHSSFRSRTMPSIDWPRARPYREAGLPVRLSRPLARISRRCPKPNPAS